MEELDFITPLEAHGQRIDYVIANSIGSKLSRTQIKNLINSGDILLNNEACRPKDKLVTGDEVKIFLKEREAVSWKPQKLTLDIEIEEKDFLIVNKRHGVVMHPGAGCFDGTLANALLYHYPDLEYLPRCGIVHRLDKDTSGLVVVARTNEFRNHIVNELLERKVNKYYQAIIKGHVIGTLRIDDPIARDKRNRLKMAISRDGREAISIISENKRYGGYSLVDINIETGRTHQIRLHLSHHKHPIIGDKTYGSGSQLSKGVSERVIRIINAFPRQALHAKKIEFRLLNKQKKFKLEVNLPKDMQELLSLLK